MNRITLAAALTLATLSTAFAQSSADQQACMNDAFRVCSATIPDRARTTACMIQNKSQLSAGCQAVMAKYSPAGTPTMQTASTPAPVRSAPQARIKTAVDTTRPGKPLNILAR